MIRSFRDIATEDRFNGGTSKAARLRLPGQLWKIGRRKQDAVDQAEALDDLRVPPGNRVDLLKGDRAGQQGIRINHQYQRRGITPA